MATHDRHQHGPGRLRVGGTKPLHASESDIFNPVLARPSALPSSLSLSRQLERSLHLSLRRAYPSLHDASLTHRSTSTLFLPSFAWAPVLSTSTSTKNTTLTSSVMKFSTFALSAAAIAVSVSSRPLARRDVNPDLVPQFGVQPGVNPDGTGCVSARAS
ncbi:hypothetical protein NUW54_g9597 [Trametes sanguinea]|uniref:Uncharacterized protein n=1 Tax=Trametes sanguinea TaxID=158606 RepID=A0ACC1P5U5_9APHY|nr:hypothetical protein NUW54_g9597 [Trametes sanguinea]